MMNLSLELLSRTDKARKSSLDSLVVTKNYISY